MLIIEGMKMTIKFWQEVVVSYGRQTRKCVGHVINITIGEEMQSFLLPFRFLTGAPGIRPVNKRKAYRFI